MHLHKSTQATHILR